MYLHLHSRSWFKTHKVDIFIHSLLKKERNTRVALIGRLLERGTERLPDMLSLNRFVDQLYGAYFGVEVEQVGDRQCVHLSFEVVDERYAGGENLLECGLRFLGEVLYRPRREGEGFCREYLCQEKKALGQYIDNLFNDKMAYARHRCIEEMCRGAPCGLSSFGDRRDFRGIGAVSLFEFHRQWLASSPIDVFISGRAVSRAAPLCAAVLGRRPLCAPLPPFRRAPASPRVREFFEAAEIHQDRLVLGYRTGTTALDEDYAALAVFNSLLGGEGHSLLFGKVREEAGLCYYIASQLEPICGLLLVEVVLEVGACARVRRLVDEQFEAVRAGHFSAGRFERARILVLRRLEALEDSRDALVHFYLHCRVAGLRASRRQWLARLEHTRPAQVQRVARAARLDTVFLLHAKR